ncbi:MAG: hypothetical protein K8R88_09060 [Armatimonadetes bacterium]|nr:hypothetical protein [Armatimonadota bacterium]
MIEYNKLSKHTAFIYDRRPVVLQDETELTKAVEYGNNPSASTTNSGRVVQEFLFEDMSGHFQLIQTGSELFKLFTEAICIFTAFRDRFRTQKNFAFMVEDDWAIALDLVPDGNDLTLHDFGVGRVRLHILVLDARELIVNRTLIIQMLNESVDRFFRYL